MASIAIVGPDGAGKTTLANMLAESSNPPLKYLYMGVNVKASRISLPTTRWVHQFKNWSENRTESSRLSTESQIGQSIFDKLRSSFVWGFLRLLNRLGDEWYRQLVAWYYEYQGFVVLYDRHFALDFVEPAEPGRVESFDNRLHRWLVSHLYPRPGLVIFLDAPAHVVFARKPEWTVAELEHRRQALARLQNKVSRFVRIDATQPLETVYGEAAGCVRDYCRGLRVPQVIPEKRSPIRSETEVR